MKFTRLAGLAVAALLSMTGIALAQAVVTLPSINSNDAFQDIVRGVPTAQAQYISALQMAGFGDSLPTKVTALVGGDATTNLFQRGTTGASQTTTIAYGGPDRWAYWSGTSTAMTLSQDTTAADLPSTGFKAAFKMARTSGQTGVVQMCMTQEVESINSYQFQGATAELDFHATAGANFSAASSNVVAYIVTGTGTDEGISKLAFAFNAGGGGSSTWAGQANATAAVIPITTVNGRYAAVATIPATATEIAVILCYTPVGTAGTNDYVAFSGIQLVRNASVASAVSTTVGYSCDTGVLNCTSFWRRPQGEETLLQQRYYYELDESAAIYIVAPCAAIDTTHTNCIVQLPATMRAAPTATYANGFATPTSTTQATLGACTTLGSAATVASTVGSLNQFLVNCTAGTVPAAGVASFLYSNNGTGKMKFAAEL